MFSFFLINHCLYCSKQDMYVCRDVRKIMNSQGQVAHEQTLGSVAD